MDRKDLEREMDFIYDTDIWGKNASVVAITMHREDAITIREQHAKILTNVFFAVKEISDKLYVVFRYD